MKDESKNQATGYMLHLMVNEEMAIRLQTLKREQFYDVARSVMFREVLRRGLDAIEAENRGDA